MENCPLVSAVIAVYNGEQFLAEALNSALAQTYRPIEIIVVDDGSTDRSCAIAQAYAEVRYIYQSHHGLSVSRNIGIHAARGEFIAFLDADDLWTPNKLSIQLAYMREHPELGYTGTRAQLFLESNVTAPTWLRENVLTKDHADLTPSALVIRRQVFEQIGYFDSHYGISNDLDWLSRALDGGVQKAIVPEMLLSKRLHTTNLSFHAQQTLQEMLQIARASIERKHQGRCAA